MSFLRVTPEIADPYIIVTARPLSWMGRLTLLLALALDDVHVPPAGKARPAMVSIAC
jgi:hypothetical protein